MNRPQYYSTFNLIKCIIAVFGSAQILTAYVGSVLPQSAKLN